MAIELSSSHEGPLEIRPGLPGEYNGPILRGAAAFSLKTNLAQIVLQEMTGENYSIRFIIGRVLKKIYAKGWLDTKGLYGCFMLKNGIRKEINTIDKLHLRQDQYACFFTDPTDISVRFDKDNEFRALDFFYSLKFLEELLPYFPELKAVINSPGTLLSGKGCWTLPSMSEIIQQFLNCGYDESTSRLYFDLKVRELLLEMLENAFKRKPEDHFFTPWEKSKIHEARDILESYIPKKPPSMKFLSRQVALNEYKLKTGFRQYFNAGLFEWLTQRKMQHAKNLILTTDKPVKEIASMVGYPLTTNFITAFRRKFGMTPGSLRRKLY